MSFRAGVFCWGLVAALAFCGRAAHGQDGLVPGAFRVDPPTLHSLGFRWYVEGDDDGDAVCTVKYRQVGDETWLEAMPLLRVNRETVDRDFAHYGRDSGTYTVGNLLAGSILFLRPDTEYEVRLELRDPDGGEAVRTERVRTGAVPLAPAPQRTLHLYPPDFAGQRQEPAYERADVAVALLQAGDLLVVHPGIHAGGAVLRASGTAAAPIRILGPGAATAVWETAGDINLDVSGRDHVFVEGLALRGGRVGIMAQGSRQLTVRHCEISQVKYGIFNDREEAVGWYVADNTLTGIDAHWIPRQQENAAETGIVVYGRGHVVEYNRIRRFWDCLTVADFGRPAGGVEGVDRHCVAIDFNNNDLSNARDDLLEVDFSSHNVRVFDNRLYNGHTGVSAQPLYGGPAYFVGNVLYAVQGSVYKLHNWPAGIYILHNTSMAVGQAWRSAPLWQNTFVYNNLILGGGDGYTIESGSPDPRTRLDYNGWSRNNDDPARFIKFTDDGTLSGAAGYRFGSLEDFAAATGNGAHSMLVDPGVFAEAAYPRAGETYEPGSVDLRLKEGAAPVDAGLRLPNITRFSLGGGPDLGAYERGRPLPQYGPRPARATFVSYRAEAAPRLQLAAAGPNPFNAGTALRFILPAAAVVELAAYDSVGQKVAVLAAGQRPAGTYEAVWDGRDRQGRPVASGAYLLVLRAGGQTARAKVLVLR